MQYQNTIVILHSQKQKIMFTLQKAKRQQVKLRLNLSAPSGAGKTYSALLLAKGLVGSWDKIAVIDTKEWYLSREIFNVKKPSGIFIYESEK